ncbi:hypothetical protein, partial [Tamlana crocina]|uniref:hypothetical protein n=1 Tax=Tamlana crocina TaxID=393006 RepID=UPI001ADD69C8
REAMQTSCTSFRNTMTSTNSAATNNMPVILKDFQKHLSLQLPQPLEQSGEIRHKDFRIRYVLTKETSVETGLDLKK